MAHGLKGVHGDSRPLGEGADDGDIGHGLQRSVLEAPLLVPVAESVALPLDGCELLLEEGILLAELFVFFLEALGDVLQSNISLYLPLLVLLDLGL